MESKYNKNELNDNGSHYHLTLSFKIIKKTDKKVAADYENQ